MLNTELPAAVVAVTKGPYSMGFVTHTKNVDETGPHPMNICTELNFPLSLQTLSEVIGQFEPPDPLSAEASSECAEASI